MASLHDVCMPTGQQEGTESVIARWLKQVGESIKAHEPLIEINTDKVVVEVPAPCDGTLSEILKREGDKVEPGMLLGRMSEGLVSSAANKSAPAAQPSMAKPAACAGSAARAELSPAVRRLLKDNGISPEQITGSGRDGRITAEDVEAFIAKNRSSGQLAAQRSGKLVKHDQMRRSIAAHMVESMRLAPHVTSVFELDMTRVMQHREEHKAAFEAKGVKLTFTAYFVLAVARALQAVPLVNSRWHDDALELFEDCNIGVATALEDKGLIVPVVQQAQRLDLFGVAGALQALIEKARAGKLETKDVQGGTFTISNHGVSGSLLAAPIIINQPQSAILGIGKLEKRVCVEEVNGKDTFVARPKVYVTLTLDHRSLDGFVANGFLKHFVDTLENFA
jgi:2-oxoglutarate dehydrogenase E2 component (dihydrolipoamide succinyltransferase)